MYWLDLLRWGFLTSSQNEGGKVEFASWTRTPNFSIIACEICGSLFPGDSIFTQISQIKAMQFLCNKWKGSIEKCCESINAGLVTAIVILEISFIFAIPFLILLLVVSRSSWIVFQENFEVQRGSFLKLYLGLSWLRFPEGFVE